jgi:hypothetical protein
VYNRTLPLPERARNQTPLGIEQLLEQTLRNPNHIGGDKAQIPAQPAVRIPGCYDTITASDPKVTGRCNYGRLCGSLSIGGRDVGQILIQRRSCPFLHLRRHELSETAARCSVCSGLPASNEDK